MQDVLFSMQGNQDIMSIKEESWIVSTLYLVCRAYCDVLWPKCINVECSEKSSDKTVDFMCVKSVK